MTRVQASWRVCRGGGGNGGNGLCVGDCTGRLKDGLVAVMHVTRASCRVGGGLTWLTRRLKSFTLLPSVPSHGLRDLRPRGATVPGFATGQCSGFSAFSVHFCPFCPVCGCPGSPVVVSVYRGQEGAVAHSSLPVHSRFLVWSEFFLHVSSHHGLLALGSLPERMLCAGLSCMSTSLLGLSHGYQVDQLFLCCSVL